MTPEQRKRAGLAIARRIKEMGEAPSTVARAAGVDPKTLRNMMDGKTWPSDAVQRRVEAVLRWQEGEISARAVEVSTDSILYGLTDSELCNELLRRLLAREKRDARLRRTDRDGKRSPA